MVSIENHISKSCKLTTEHRFCDTFNRLKATYVCTKGDHAFTAVNTRAKLTYKKQPPLLLSNQEA